MVEITNPTDLSELMSFIGERYKFNGDSYPKLRGVTDPDAIKAFALSHSLKHMNKSIGVLATESERLDHGGSMSSEALKKGTVKMFINVLKLAEELDITAEELGTSIPEYMRSA